MSLKCSVGGRDSDSFATIVESDQYLEKYQSPNKITWDGISDEQKEVRLKLAAHVMGMLPLKGRTVYCGQALCFPRTSHRPVTTIPDAVKEAQSYIALDVVHRALLAKPDSSEGPDEVGRVTRVSLGGLLSASFAADAVKGGTVLERIGRATSFAIHITLKRYLAQFRFGSVAATDDDDYPECSTTTTTTTTTSSTSSSTTTTA